LDHVVHVHLCVGQYSKEFLQKLRRVNNITPKNYLDFISTYTKLLNQKDKFVLDQCHRLDGGLTKLMEASEQIKVLNQQLEVQKVAVTKKSEACEILLKDILEKKGLGEEKREMAKVLCLCMSCNSSTVRICKLKESVVSQLSHSQVLNEPSM